MLLADDVRLVAPMTPVTHTLADGERAFSAIFDLIPDLTAEVHGWGATDSGVLIDFTLSGSAGGAPISWRAVDRIEIGEDGLATERVSLLRLAAADPRHRPPPARLAGVRAQPPWPLSSPPPPSSRRGSRRTTRHPTASG